MELTIDKNEEYSVSEISQMLDGQNTDHFILDFYIAPGNDATGKKLQVKLNEVEYVFKDKNGNVITEDEKLSFEDMSEISIEATRHLKSEVIDDDNSGDGTEEPSDGSEQTETGKDNFTETDEENTVIVNVNRTFNIDANDLEDIQSLRALADYFNQFMYINTGESVLLPKGKLVQKVQEMLPNEDPNSFRVFDQYGNIADRIEMIDSLSPMKIELDKDKEYSYQDVKDLMWDEANKQDYPQFYIGSVNDSNKNAVKFSFNDYQPCLLDKDGKSIDSSDSLSGAEWASAKLIYRVGNSKRLTVLPR